MKKKPWALIFGVLFLLAIAFLVSQDLQKKPPQLKPGANLKNIKMLKTFPDCGTVNYMGRTYHTVQIGSQCWLRENLDAGQAIAQTLNQVDNNKIEKYAPYDDAVNFALYGGLYQWPEAMGQRIVAPAQGICPPGFHIPSEAEWDTLVTFLGGEATAGAKMKEAGFVCWNEGNTGATNESGFSARGAGIRDYNSGLILFREEAWFWTDSGSANDKTARCLVLRSNGSDVQWKNIKWTTGISVRCLR